MSINHVNYLELCAIADRRSVTGSVDNLKPHSISDRCTVTGSVDYLKLNSVSDRSSITGSVDYLLELHSISYLNRQCRLLETPFHI